MFPMKIRYPKREQRKEQSSTALIGAAIDLFANRGYEETTLESVADKAGLHVQTLYRHFPTKSDLSQAISHEGLMKFEEYYRARECDALTAWRDWIKLRARAVKKRGAAEYSQEIINLWSYPTTHTSKLKISYRYEEVLAEGIAEDMNIDVNRDPLPLLIACMLWGGNLHAVQDWADSGGKTDLEKVTLRVVDTVRDQFQHLLSGSKRHQSR